MTVPVQRSATRSRMSRDANTGLPTPAAYVPAAQQADPTDSKPSSLHPSPWCGVSTRSHRLLGTPAEGAAHQVRGPHARRLCPGTTWPSPRGASVFPPCPPNLHLVPTRRNAGGTGRPPAFRAPRDTEAGTSAPTWSTAAAGSRPQVPPQLFPSSNPPGPMSPRRPHCVGCTDVGLLQRSRSRCPGVGDPAGHPASPAPLSARPAPRGSGLSRVLNSLWIIHECTPSPLTVTGKSQIEFFSSPEKNPINIPGVRRAHHLAFPPWAGGYLEATWNLPAGIRFPSTHYVPVNEIRGLGGALRIT